MTTFVYSSNDPIDFDNDQELSKEVGSLDIPSGDYLIVARFNSIARGVFTTIVTDVMGNGTDIAFIEESDSSQDKISRPVQFSVVAKFDSPVTLHMLAEILIYSGDSSLYGQVYNVQLAAIKVPQVFGPTLQAS